MTPEQLDCIAEHLIKKALAGKPPEMVEEARKRIAAGGANAFRASLFSATIMELAVFPQHHLRFLRCRQNKFLLFVALRLR